MNERTGRTRRFRIHDPEAEREARRYARPIPSREAILALLVERGELMKAERIAEALGLDEESDREALSKRLSAMVRDGQLLQNRRGGYGPAEKLDLLPGSVLANAEGYGFFRPDSGGEDVYLSPTQMRAVLHGDRVLVSIVGVDRRGRAQGAIVEVLERANTRLVGRYHEQDGIGFVVPEDRRIHLDVLVPARHAGGAKDGQIVVVELVEQPTPQRQPIGRVLRVLGDSIVPALAIETAIHSHSLPCEWPEDVEREAAAIATEVAEHEIEDREDLRRLPLVTIDGEDARDFDDAVYAERKRSGFRLIVAIADVSHYVVPGSALDREAQLRGTSVYFPQRVLPMLPERLSNGICSLNPGVDRLCMACELDIDRDGRMRRSRFFSAVMRSRARLSYTEVWAALSEPEGEHARRLAELMPHLQTLHALYQRLAQARRQRGAIEFETGEVAFRLDPDGAVEAVQVRARNDAHRLIEECMIAANVAAAQFLLRSKLPAPYRVHEPPPASRLEDLRAFLAELGIKLSAAEDVTPGEFSDVLRRTRDRVDASLIQTLLLRSQSLAVYQPENLGHFGLALEAYTHFTSPIRRYADLLVHRAIRHALAGGKSRDFCYSASDMKALTAQCSFADRRAEEASRAVVERYKCAWMASRIGEPFAGLVAGVTSYGLFVELVDSQVSGLVHITQLPNDYYHFDPLRHQLTGERRGLRFRLGDVLTVKATRVDMTERKIDFVLDDSAEPGRASASRRGQR